MGLDPGTSSSAIVGYSGHTTSDALLASNEEILAWLKEKARLEGDSRPMLVIEKIASYGLAVGESTFQTVFWSGRFAEAYGIDKVDRITRGEVKMHLCRNMRAKDANVRMALLDKFGGKEKAIGNKKNKGIMHGITSHRISAFAVAVTYYETRQG